MGFHETAHIIDVSVEMCYFVLVENSIEAMGWLIIIFLVILTFCCIYRSAVRERNNQIDKSSLGCSGALGRLLLCTRIIIIYLRGLKSIK